MWKRKREGGNVSGEMIHEDGSVVTNEEFQEWLKEEINLCGFVLLCNFMEPEIGEVRTFCALPMRVVRHVSHEEAERHQNKLRERTVFDLRRSKIDALDPERFYFAVEVAD